MTPDHVIHKIKAHVKLEEIEDDLALYLALGNHYADQAAQWAANNIHKDMVSMWKEQHEQTVIQGERYEQVVQLSLALQFARAQADEGDEPVPPQPRVLVNLSNNMLRSFNDPWTSEDTWEEDWLHYSLWGVQCMHSAMLWFREAKWPCDQPIDDPGVSWAEIALSLARCHNWS